MSGDDAFYGVFWVLPTVPLPMPGEIISDGNPLPDALLTKRLKLQQALATLDTSKTADVRDAIAHCDQYVVSLRAARAVWDDDTQSTWTSAIVEESVTIPLLFEEPMTMILEATLLLNLGASIADSRSPECISESAQCFCQAAGVVDFVLALEDDISSEYQIDVPVELPELSPRILHALFDMALIMAQQLAIVKAALHFDQPYSQTVLQKLHVACQLSYESFESAVVRSCYTKHPKRDGCASLLGFATIFSRLHRALALQVEGQVEFTADRIGEAIAYISAALHQLQERQSMGSIGLPPLANGDPESRQVQRLVPLIRDKRMALQATCDAWTKDNDRVYFATIPLEESILAVILPQVLIMKAEYYDSNTITRLGSGGDDAREDLERAMDEIADDQPRQRSGGRADDDSSRSMSNSSTPGSEAEVPGHETAEPPAKSSAVSALELLPSTLTFAQSQRPLVASRSTRRMGARVLPQKAATSRTLLTMVGRQDSLVMLNLSDEQLKRHVTDESLVKMKQAMTMGKEVYRLSKEKWKKEVLRIQDDQLVLTRKKGFGLLSLSKQLKIPWGTIHAFQHELMPVNQVLQLLAPRGKRMTSILVIAGRGDQVNPTEFALPSPEENACAMACLQGILQDKRRQSV